MKALSISFSMALLFLVGCGKDSDSSTATNEVSGGNPITAPVDYLDAVNQAKQRSEKTIDTIALNQAIQQFYAGEDHFPKDLEELVAKGYLREIPKPPYGKKFSYDALTGKLKVVDQ